MTSHSIFRNPFVYFWDKAVERSRFETMRVKLMNGLEFKIHTGNSDINTLTEVFATNGYAKFLSLITPGSTAVDVGANFGAVSVGMAQRGARVTAFEPNPYIVGLIKENADLNNLDVEVVEKGIASEPCFATMYFEPGAWGGGALIKDSLTSAKSVSFEVECVTLPEADYLKLDCEGMEYDILKSSPLGYKAIFVEYHEPRVEKIEIRTLLEKSGYFVTHYPEMNSYLAT